MKTLQSSLIRAIVAIIVGTLIIKYREETVRWLTIACGTLFFISGLISCAVYYSNMKSVKEQMNADKEKKKLMERAEKELARKKRARMKGSY